MSIRKHLLRGLAALCFVACVAATPPGKYQPRLTKARAVRLASMVPYPSGYSLHLYARKGTAYFYPSLRQWGVRYGWTSRQPTAFGADAFIIWIDDATGKLDHYGFGH